MTKEEWLIALINGEYGDYTKTSRRCTWTGPSKCYYDGAFWQLNKCTTQKEPLELEYITTNNFWLVDKYTNRIKELT